jgi:hypothetical protein
LKEADSFHLVSIQLPAGDDALFCGINQSATQLIDQRRVSIDSANAMNRSVTSPASNQVV